MRMYVWNGAEPWRDGDLEAGIVIHGACCLSLAYLQIYLAHNKCANNPQSTLTESALD